MKDGKPHGLVTSIFSNKVAIPKLANNISNPLQVLSITSSTTLHVVFFMSSTLLTATVLNSSHVTSLEYSLAHLENVKKVAAIPSKTLINRKATTSPLEASRSSSTLGPFRVSSSLTPRVPPSLPIAQHLHESVARLSVTPPPTPILRLSLLDRLKAVIDSLPAEVPYGVDSDDLAIFAGSPRAYIQQDDEAWENIDPMLNQVISYGATRDL